MNLPATYIPHPQDVVLPTKAPETSLVLPGALYARIMTLHQRMDEHVGITDAATFRLMRDLVKDASKLKKEIELARQIAKDPYYQIGKNIDAAAAKITALIDMVVNEGKAQETAYLTERDRQIAAEQQRIALAEATATTDTSRPTAPLQVMMAVPEAVDAPIQQRRVVYVDNPALVPEEYWVRSIDRAKLDADALAGKIIPGVSVGMEQQVVAR